LNVYGYTNFHKQIPEEHLHKLRKSKDPADIDQLEQETKALERIKKLEIVTVLARRKMLPRGFELCMCDTVQEIFREPRSYHLYFKYLKSLEGNDVNLLQDIVTSFYSVLKSNNKQARNSESVKNFTTLAFALIDFMTEYGYYTDAEKVMSVLMQFLSESHHLDIWMTKYHGYIKLMRLRNRNYNFVSASQAYQCAVEMTWQIKMMSFGQDIVNEGEVQNELSHMLLELGSINPAYSWSLNALKVTVFVLLYRTKTLKHFFNCSLKTVYPLTLIALFVCITTTSEGNIAHVRAKML